MIDIKKVYHCILHNVQKEVSYYVVEPSEDDLTGLPTSTEL
jgi:hypothetical protein